MGLSLRGSTSGSIDINPPAVAGNNTITLPGDNGSANQFFRNSTIAGIVTYSSMVEDSSGNIGIGSETPGASLDIAKTTPVIRFTDTDAGQYAELLNSGSSFYISADRGNGGNGDIIFRSGGTSEKLRITSGGNIGIGTDSPGAKLHIDSTTTNTPLVVEASQNNRSRLVFRNNQETGTECTVELIDEDLRFNTNSGERMRIVKDGNIGIGLTNPGDYVSEANQLVIAGTGQRGITIASTNSGNSNIYFADGTSGSEAYRGVVRYEHSSDSMQFWTAGSERMRIRSDGATVTNGTTILFGNTSTASSPRSISFGSNEISWTAEGSGGTNLFLNACDSAGNNGSSYAMIFRGLASSGTAQATLSGVSFDSSVFTATGVYNQSTVAAANVHIASGGTLYRSTSSAAYKKDIETLSDSYADALLECRPVWYRSTANGDKQHPDWGYWGFIAEEVAEIDPRLIFWKTHEYITDVDGNTTAEELDEPIAEGVQYDRFVPHLLNLIKRQKEQIETLETTNASQAVTIAALDARLTSLEGA